MWSEQHQVSSLLAAEKKHRKKIYYFLLLGVWLVLLVPWSFLNYVAMFAFDSGLTIKAYVFAYSIWTYPVAVLIAIVLSIRWPRTLLLPVVNLVAFLVIYILF